MIARPMKAVRLIVAASSGCCAIEASACATPRPSASAGAIEPTLTATDAMMIEMTATHSRPLSSAIIPPIPVRIPPQLVLHAGGRRDVDHREHREDVRLDRAD